jgi:hypothetical protein
VVGENIYEYRGRGMSFVRAAIQGARDLLVPVTFSIVTNIVAFLPLCFIPGVMGNIWRVIPFVVITVFAISWVEALLILPCHLAHGRRKSGGRGVLRMLQSRVRDLMVFNEAVAEGWITAGGRGSVSWHNVPPAVETLFTDVYKSDPRKLHPYRASVLLEQARRFSRGELLLCQHLLTEASERAVTTSTPPAILLELLLVRLLRPR